MKYKVLPIFIMFCLLSACKSQNKLQEIDAEYINLRLYTIAQDMEAKLDHISLDSTLIPRSLDSLGQLIAGNSREWTSGFFPGTLWQIYGQTQNRRVWQAAQDWTSFIEKEKWDTHTHDLGFKINSCFGKANDIEANEDYQKTIMVASQTLIKRYNPLIKSIRSWDWNANEWQFPVIIDNMMNLEMLFDASEMSGDSIYYDIAYQHALTTLQNHFRPDYSAYHVVDYDTISADVRMKVTHQGYSDESAWARGQAWALYGYTTAYARTNDSLFLNQAINIAKYFFNHPNLPEDKIAYWDFNAPNIPNEPRDVSASAIAACGLLKLIPFDTENRETYLKWVDEILLSLNQPKYQSAVAPFILDHSTGSFPGHFEVDVPIVYGDYYYIEALIRRLDYL